MVVDLQVLPPVSPSASHRQALLQEELNILARQRPQGPGSAGQLGVRAPAQDPAPDLDTRSKLRLMYKY